MGGLFPTTQRSLPAKAKRRPWLRLAAFAVSALLALNAKAQDAPEEDVTFIQISPEGVPMIAAPGATAPNAATAPKTPEEKRLDELLKLKFDRSAASILKAQATLASSLPSDAAPAERFRLDVVAGRWPDAGAFLKTLPAKDAARVYEHLIKELSRPPANAQNPGQQQVMGPAPSPTLLQQEVADIADIAPADLSEEQLNLLGALLSRVLAGSSYIDPLMKRLEQGSAQLGGSDTAKRERAAQLLLNAGRDLDAAKFLPPLDAARPTASFQLLEKHVRCRFTEGRTAGKKEMIDQAWALNETMLAAADCPADFRERAWRRAVEIAPFLPTAVAAQWMKKTFAGDPQRGLTLLNALAAQLASQRTNRDVAQRRKNLELQREIVSALLSDTAHRAQWQPAVNLFATNWMEEADYSRRYYTPPRNQNAMFDEDGNRIFYGNQSMQQQFNPNQLPPVPLPEVVTATPGVEWLAALDASLLPRLLTSLAQAQLKLEDEAKALPYLEQLAPFQPKETLAMANELLGVWARVRDPQRNLPQRRSNVIYYSSGIQQQQQGVPLTRALQQRYLEELSALLVRLRKLPIGALDDSAIVGAFTAAHSPAEVYRGEAIELVLGKLDQIKPQTLSEVLQAMRVRLATQWRKPSVQQQAKTQRTDAQIDAEILRGYELLDSLLAKALAKQPDDWRLHLTEACTAFDWAEFQYGKKVDLAIYVEKRERAFDAFQKAAELYAKALPAMEQSAETPVIYQQWLNANLGASDLAFVTRQQEANAKSLLRIREAILALPGEAVTRHLDALAKTVAAGTDSLPGHLKPGYMRAALAIVGERESAAEIRKLVEYYDGLLREIELNLRVDGDTTVGHGVPFGAFLTVRHTSELERENAGGFGKYLRNQSQTPYYFNPYGTAPIEHRDNLEKQMREKLGEGFEILSVTFHDDKVQSRGYGRDGWRETPLAYLLLKAKDASVDRIPALRLDVDFIDKHGPVVLPVESAVQLIDARPDVPPARPVADLEVSQVLDDRALGEGKLTLEIKATAKGLPPAFDELFDFAPTDFKIDELADSGPAIQRLDSTGAELAGASERNWLIKLSAQRGAGSNPRFQFPKPRQEIPKIAYKRYQDADLVEVAPDLALTGFPLRPERAWLWALLGCLVVALPGWALFRLRRKSSAGEAVSRYELPPEVTPFATLQLLRRMHGDEQLALSTAQRDELARTIAEIEGFYFARRNGMQAPNLQMVGNDWVNRSRAGAG
jgi:hypothetical protein